MSMRTGLKRRPVRVQARELDEQFAHEIDLVQRAARGESLLRFEIHLYDAQGQQQTVEHYTSPVLAVRSGQNWSRRAPGNWFTLHESHNRIRFCCKCDQWQPVHAAGSSFTLICDECGAPIDDSVPA